MPEIKEVIIRTVIFIDGVAQDETLFSMDCSETMHEQGITNDREIVDNIFNDEELNPHYRY